MIDPIRLVADGAVSDEALLVAEVVVEHEWEQFQAVTNEGGRASCQSDWPTFHQMRLAQFLAWPVPLVVSGASPKSEGHPPLVNGVIDTSSSAKSLPPESRLMFRTCRVNVPPAPDEKSIVACRQVESLMLVRAGNGPVVVEATSVPVESSTRMRRSGNADE